MARTYHHRTQKTQHNGHDYWSRNKCNRGGAAGYGSYGSYGRKILHVELRMQDKHICRKAMNDAEIFSVEPQSIEEDYEYEHFVDARVEESDVPSLTEEMLIDSLKCVINYK